MSRKGKSRDKSRSPGAVGDGELGDYLSMGTDFLFGKMKKIL